MQSQHLHLQSIESQQMHPRQQQQQQHQHQHQFQIHHLQHQQSHHPQQQHHHQTQQHRQQSQPPQHSQQQPNTSHSQHHLSTLHHPHLTSLALNTTNPTPQSNSHFSHHHHHFPLSTTSPPTSHHQQPQTSNPFAPVQPMQMQPLLPTHQPSAFGNLTNLSGSILQAAVVDDPPSNPHHFQNSQSPDALTNPYPWDSTHQPHPTTLQNQPQQQQPLLPIPLVGDTRPNNRQNPPSNHSFPAQKPPSQSFAGQLNTNMAVLGSSLNTMTGLVNPNSIPQNPITSSLNPSPPDLSHRNTFSLTDAHPPNKSIKKSRTNLAHRKNAPTRTRNSRAPITSPVSTATLPNISQPSAAPSNPPLDHHHAVSSPTAQMPTIVSSPTHTRARGIPGKPKGRMRVPSRGMDGAPDLSGPAAMSSNTSVGMVAPTTRDDPAPGSTTTALPSALAPQNFDDPKNVSTTVAWSTPKKTSTSRSRSRRKGDGTTTSLPVHLRNPKKGRARVFRECKACRHENHIRRSDCSNCKAPLPAGKRRRDGNPSYDSKRQAGAASATSVPNTHMVGQPVARGRGGVKDDIAVSSVMSK